VSAESFAKAVDRLLKQVSHWEQPRWSAGNPTKADLVHGLIQRIADLGAEAENRPHRQVPRLSDLILRDQLRVMADDLLAAAPPEERLKLAADEVDTLRRSL
jgi:hypothetical protein